MPGPGRRLGKTDIAPKIRKSFIRAVKDRGGAEYLDKLMIDSLEKDFVATLNALAKFNPQTKNINKTHTLEFKVDSSVAGWIEGFKAGESALEHQQKPAIEHTEPVTMQAGIELDVSEVVEE